MLFGWSESHQCRTVSHAPLARLSPSQTSRAARDSSRLTSTPGAWRTDGRENRPCRRSRQIAELNDKIAARYGIYSRGRMAAQMVPVVWAAAGAAINALHGLFTKTWRAITPS